MNNSLCPHIPVTFTAGTASICIAQALHTGDVTLQTLSLIWYGQHHKHQYRCALWQAEHLFHILDITYQSPPIVRSLSALVGHLVALVQHLTVLVEQKIFFTFVQLVTTETLLVTLCAALVAPKSPLVGFLPHPLDQTSCAESLTS